MNIAIEDDQTEPNEMRRIGLDVLIVHPTLNPIAITAGMKLEPSFQHRVGDKRNAPSGVALRGVHPDTRWRHSRVFDVRGQHFENRLMALVDELSERRLFIRELLATGGSCQLILNFMGDGYLGDTVSSATLKALGDLGLDLGIECFTVPQR